MFQVHNNRNANCFILLHLCYLLPAVAMGCKPKKKKIFFERMKRKNKKQNLRFIRIE